MSNKKRGWGKTILGALAALVVLVLQALREDGGGSVPAPAPGPVGVEAGASVGGGEQRILSAFAEERSGFMVQVDGQVERTLADDEKGSRHQRFILRLSGGHSVLVAHNIDLAPRVPLRNGDEIQVFGQYEWNDLGGVLHWTHLDPRGRHEDGWIRHGGRLFQ